MLDNLACTGTETRLIDCPHNGLNIHNCVHSQDIGVRCIQSPTRKCHTVFVNMSMPIHSLELDTSLGLCFVVFCCDKDFNSNKKSMLLIKLC